MKPMELPVLRRMSEERWPTLNGQAICEADPSPRYRRGPRCPGKETSSHSCAQTQAPPPDARAGFRATTSALFPGGWLTTQRAIPVTASVLAGALEMGRRKLKAHLNEAKQLDRIQRFYDKNTKHTRIWAPANRPPWPALRVQAGRFPSAVRKRTRVPLSAPFIHHSTASLAEQ